MSIAAASHVDLGERYLYCDGDVPLLFTENETNNERLFGGQNASPYVKDGVNDYVIQGKKNAVNPARTGTKCRGALRIEFGCREDSTDSSTIKQSAPEAYRGRVQGFQTDHGDSKG